MTHRRKEKIETKTREFDKTIDELITGLNEERKQQQYKLKNLNRYIAALEWKRMDDRPYEE